MSKASNDWQRNEDDWSDPGAFAHAPWPEPLTPEQARRLFGKQAQTVGWISPLRLVLLQVLVALVCAGVWSVLGKADRAHFAASSLCGGAVVIVPSLLFALRLLAMRARPSVSGLVISEALKIFLTIALLLAVVVGYKDLHWVPMLVTYVLVLKINWIAVVLR